MGRHSASRRGTRSLLALVVVVVAVLGGLVLVSGFGDREVEDRGQPADAGATTPSPSATEAVGPRTPSPISPSTTARLVLAQWDARRAAAWADGSTVELKTLYVPGSPAGERDVAMLRTWLRHGLTVDDLATELIRVDVLPSRAERLRLRVTDRVTRAEAVGPSGHRSLPRDRRSTYVVVMELFADEWRTWSVREE